MSIEDAVIQGLRVLPPDKQFEVLDFIEFLQQSASATRPGRPLEGFWADLELDITQEDLDEMRREVWGGNPRDMLGDGDGEGE